MPPPTPELRRRLLLTRLVLRWGERRGAAANLAVDPEHVAVDDKKDVVEQRQHPRDTATRIEQLGFVGYLDARVVSAGKLRSDHRRFVMHIYDDGLDSGERQPIDRVIQQGAAVYFNERFRNGFGHRTQAGADPSGEHHRRPRYDAHADRTQNTRPHTRMIRC